MRERCARLESRVSTFGDLEDLRVGRADVVAVNAVDALGVSPQQVFARVRAAEAAGAGIVGPGVRFDGTGIIAGVTAA